ncbi:MAG: hypothetical protein RMJ98_02555 [Myxococcales bacterium]|nr:hypothetical protein [Polyangiaceae bacterium]MDW8248170.1 hypothetical protein [Myxococcales bacterium]
MADRPLVIQWAAMDTEATLRQAYREAHAPLRGFLTGEDATAPRKVDEAPGGSW